MHRFAATFRTARAALLAVLCAACTPGEEGPPPVGPNAPCREQLAPQLVCDGRIDCPEAEDERDCATIFLCADEQKAIPSDWRCDGDTDCLDGSDETEDECTDVFKCGAPRGDTVAAGATCDGVIDCEDASDELWLCSGSHAVPFTCEGRSEIWAMFCDGEADCPDGADEAPPCAMLTCADGVTTHPITFRCDGFIDCPAHDDEVDCAYDCSANTTLAQEFCRDESDCLPLVELCAGELQCPEGQAVREDLCEALDSCTSDPESCASDSAEPCDSNPAMCSPCTDGQLVWSDFFCDGAMDCADGSDETGEGCFFECGGAQTIPVLELCDGAPDCADGSDEAAENCFFMCNDGMQIPFAWECDGREDCVDGSDEHC